MRDAAEREVVSTVAARKPKPEPTPQPAESPRLDLTIKVESFGPIRSGKVKLHPLTVLIGPNNSGKSYLARLVDALCASAARVTAYADPPPVDGAGGAADSLRNAPPRLRRLQRELERHLTGVGEDYTGMLDPALVRGHCQAALTEVYQILLPNQLLALLGVPTGDMRSTGAKEAMLAVSARPHSAAVRLDGQGGGGSVNVGAPPEVRLTVARHGSAPGVSVGSSHEWNLWLALSGEWQRLSYALASFDRRCVGEALGDLRRACWYVPAGRSGLMQGYRPIVSSVIAGAQWAGVQPARAPRLLGAVARFLSVLFQPPPEGGIAPEAVTRAELSLTGGTILVRRSEPLLAPDLRFRFDGGEVPIESASSSVGELAPLFVYLREVVRPGDLLIIEEPEAHLHPENQRLIARLFAKLVSEGLNMIITTHSDFLLEELHNLVLAHGLDERDSKRALGEYHDCTLPPDDVGVFLFSRPTNRKGEFVGSRIRELKVTAEDGIPSDEFTRVFEEMYNDSVRIRSWLPGGEEE